MTDDVKYDEVFTSRAMLDLHGFFIVTDKMDIIENPKILFNGLRPDELYLLDFIEQLNYLERATVYEELVRDNVIEIFGHPKAKVNLLYSPAGLIDMIAEAVLQLSYDYLVNDNDEKFNKLYNTVTYMESMQAIVAHYLSISFDEVRKYSLNELYKKYAICSVTFPNQVQPLKKNDEVT